MATAGTVQVEVTTPQVKTGARSTSFWVTAVSIGSTLVGFYRVESSHLPPSVQAAVAAVTPLAVAFIAFAKLWHDKGVRVAVLEAAKEISAAKSPAA